MEKLILQKLQAKCARCNFPHDYKVKASGRCAYCYNRKDTEEELGNNAEPVKDYPEDPNDTIDEDYLLEQSDNLQHYNREKDMGVGRW